MKKGKIRIIVGCVLIFLQLLSIAGNAKSGIGINFSFDSISVFMYDLIFAIGYFIVGIIGIILLISGLFASKTKHKEKEKTTIKETVETNIHYFTKKLSKTLSILFSAMSIVVIIIALSVQDSRRNRLEDWNPTIIYLLLILIFSLLILSILFQNKEKIKNFPAYMSATLLIATIVTYIEHSVFNDGIGNFRYYVNGDIVNVCNAFWAIISIILFLINFPPVILPLSKTIISKRHSSIRYREKCYKRIAQIKSYYDQGIITEEEYLRDKEEILKNIK